MICYFLLPLIGKNRCETLLRVCRVRFLTDSRILSHINLTVNVFQKKDLVNSQTLAAKAQNAISVFQTTIAELNTVASDAEATRAERQKEIEELQAEADGLSKVAENARGWASKLDNLFKSDKNVE